MKLVILIPALNEEKTLAKVINEVRAEAKKIELIDDTKVVVIDDGSIDRTNSIAVDLADDVITHNENLGLGKSFQDGIAKALELSSDLVLHIDADDQFPTEGIKDLLSPLLQNKADLVTGSRFQRKEFIPKMSRLKRFGNWMYAHAVSFLTSHKFYDVSCGFRAFNKEAIMRMNLYGDFTYTQEVLLDLFFKGLRILEVPIKMRSGTRIHGKSRIAGDILNYGYRTIMIMLKSFRDYSPLRFFGGIGIFLGSLGLSSIGFVAYHYFSTGRTSPWQSLIIIGGLFLTLGFLLIILGLLADMIGRQRRILEEILYRLKKDERTFK